MSASTAYLKQGIVITDASTISHRLPPKAFLDKNSFFVRIGDKLHIDNFRKQLQQAGYHAVGQVMEHGEYVIRVQLLMYFQWDQTRLLRIDLFDNEIDTIRTFNPEDQRSHDKNSELALLPAHEFPLDKTALLFLNKMARTFCRNPNLCPLYQNIVKALLLLA